MEDQQDHTVWDDEPEWEDSASAGPVYSIPSLRPFVPNGWTRLEDVIGQVLLEKFGNPDLLPSHRQPFEDALVPLRQQLWSGDIEAAIIDDIGGFHIIDKSYWLGPPFWQAALDAPLPEVNLSGIPIRGFIVLQAEAVERWLKDPDTPTAQPAQWEPPFAVSPYLLFMLEITRQLELRPGERSLLKAQLEHEIGKRWDDWVGSHSEEWKKIHFPDSHGLLLKPRAIKQMASFCRWPNQNQGGNPRSVSKRRESHAAEPPCVRGRQPRSQTAPRIKTRDNQKS